jgi:hypothetical protein
MVISCIPYSVHPTHRNIGQGNSPKKDPTLSGCQSREAPTPRQVTHLGPNSTEISSSNGGTQCNGENCFLRGRIDPGEYRCPPTYSNWITYIFYLGSFIFHFGCFFLAFRVLNFRGRFEALNSVFWACHKHTIN